jgi:hypothetical protein
VSPFSRTGKASTGRKRGKLSMVPETKELNLKRDF